MIHELKQTTASEKFELGFREGSKWAAKHATEEQLERLAAAEDPVHGWDFGFGPRAFSAGDLIAGILNGHTERGAFAAFVCLGLEELEDDPDFVAGFADGCLESWKEVSRGF